MRDGKLIALFSAGLALFSPAALTVAADDTPTPLNVFLQGSSQLGGVGCGLRWRLGALSTSMTSFTHICIYREREGDRERERERERERKIYIVTYM